MAEDGFASLGSRPAVSPEAKKWWESARLGELIVEQCESCGLHVFPPRGVCRRCRERAMRWVKVVPPGTIVSYTHNRNEWLPGAGSDYTLLLVEFAKHSSVRFVGRAEAFDEVTIGAQVGFRFETALSDMSRIVFTPWRCG